MKTILILIAITCLVAALCITEKSKEPTVYGEVNPSTPVHVTTGPGGSTRY